MSFKLARGPNSADPAPYPPTASPTANPRLSGNHLAITGIGVAYPKPLPSPPITPKEMYRAIRLWAWPDRKNPKLTRTPPVRDIQKGPNLSWRRPATMNVRANTTTAMVKVHVKSGSLCMLNSRSLLSSGTNKLQAYSVPKARFIERPPTTRHQRFNPVLPISID